MISAGRCVGVRGKDGAMETVTRFAERQAGSVSAIPTPGPEVARTLSVTASYLLSEDGRKASLLSGGDGRSLQQITLQVPANRLHLVSVDRQGVARLKLRPRFERDSERESSASTPRRSTTRRRRSTSSIGPLRRITNWRAPTTPSASPSARSGATTIARAGERRRGVLRGQGQRAHRPPASVAQDVLHRDRARRRAVRCRDRPGPARRTCRRRRTGDSARICERSEERNRQDQSPNSSRCTRRRSSSSPSGSRRTGPTKRRLARPPACSRWPKRWKASPIR